MKKSFKDYKLHKVNSWLIQRGTFKKEIKLDGIFSIIDGDYMGSSEFEWGAIPNSIARMIVNIDFYDFFELSEIKNSKNESLIIYGPVIFKSHIINQVKLLVKNKTRTKEGTGLESYLKDEYCYEADFWWDIQNDFYIFFDQTKKDLIKQVQINMKTKNNEYLEEGDFDYLKEHYLLTNQDLDASAIELLKTNKKELVKRLIKSLKRYNH